MRVLSLAQPERRSQVLGQIRRRRNRRDNRLVDNLLVRRLRSGESLLLGSGTEEVGFGTVAGGSGSLGEVEVVEFGVELKKKWEGEERTECKFVVPQI